MRRHIELLTLALALAAWCCTPARADIADDDYTSGEDDDASDDDASGDCTAEAQEESWGDCFECVVDRDDEDFCSKQHGDSEYEFVCIREDGDDAIEVWCTEEEGGGGGCAHLATPRIPSMAIPAGITGLALLVFLAWRRED